MRKIIVLVCCLISSFINVYSQVLEVNKTVLSEYSESVPYKPAQAVSPNPKKRKKSKDVSNDKIVAQTQNAIKNITVPVTVTDNQGKIITDLKNSDFQLFVDDKEITDFSLEDKEDSLNVVLLIDTSPSTAFQIKDLQDYAAALVNDLKPQDKVLLAEFNVDLKIDTELTENRQIISKAIKKIKSGDGTALYDALGKLFDQKIGNLDGRTALILLTDGVDTVSRKFGFSDSLGTAEKYSVPVFVVYVDNFEQQKRNIKLSGAGGISGNGGLSEIEYQNGKSYLNNLILLSGGRVSLFESVSDPRKRISPQFDREMRVKYYLEFVPPDTGKSGERKEIKVRVKRPNLSLTAKGSYLIE